MIKREMVDVFSKEFTIIGSGAYVFVKRMIKIF